MSACDHRFTECGHDRDVNGYCVSGAKRIPGSPVLINRIEEFRDEIERLSVLKNQLLQRAIKAEEVLDDLRRGVLNAANFINPILISGAVVQLVRDWEIT
jgi:hypothetical protein